LLTGLDPVCRGLGLAEFRDENGRQLYDVPGAPLPDPGIRAPVRLLPEFDNLVFAHADRTRVVPPGALKYLQPKAGQFRSPLLIDGTVAGTWRWDRAEERVVVTPFAESAADYRDEVHAEAQRIAAFYSPAGAVVIES
jgi:winged helix DNA-binding protein